MKKQMIMPKFCEHCGAPLQEGDRFCTGCGHPVAQLSQPHQPQNTTKSKPRANVPKPTPEKKRIGLKVFLIVALVAVLGYGVSEYLNDRHAQRAYKESRKNHSEPKKKLQEAEPQLGNGETADSETLDDIDWSSIIKLTDEEREYLKNNPIMVTPENSPGNPAFIDVSYDENDYANAPSYTVSVTQEKPEADFPELGIHVNMKSWNLNSVEDELVVKKLPDKIDETTGMILHCYDYHLSSSQSSFPTCVEITAPLQGDPKAFGGFVSYNSAQNRWEEVYCKISEDGRTYTAYPTHFSPKAALEKIQTEGTQAIETYKIDGKTIFTQLITEMEPNHEGAAHYLYPVAVSRTADLEKFITESQKKQLLVLNNTAMGSQTVSSQSSFTNGVKMIGFANDATSNAKAFYDFARLTPSTGPMTAFGPTVAAIGAMCVALTAGDQIMRDVDKDTIVKENFSNWIGALVSLGGTLAEYGENAGWKLATTAVGGTTIGSIASTVGTVVGAIMFIKSVHSGIIDYRISKTYPLGRYSPLSIADAACHCYMRDNAYSDNGYAKEAVSGLSAWVFSITSEAPMKNLDSAKVYQNHPEKVLNCDPKTWLPAFECLLKQYPDDFKKLNNAYDQLYYKFADAFWNESPEIQKKYFRQACKEYILVDMLDNNRNEVDAFPYASYFEPSSIPWIKDPMAKHEWDSLQRVLMNKAYKVRYKVETGQIPAGSIDYVWTEIFKDWDQNPNFEKKIIKRIKKDAVLMKKHRDRDIDLLRHKTSDVVHDFYETKRKKAVMEVKDKLNYMIVPLLNTRLAFYATNLENPNTIDEPVKYSSEELPFFAFKCDKTPQFLPINSNSVRTAFHLDLIPNKKNPVLLETTAYHYLMFGCPLEVEMTYPDNKDKTSSANKDKIFPANANWDDVEFVQDTNLANMVDIQQRYENGQYMGWGGIAYTKLKEIQKNMSETRIPIEFNGKMIKIEIKETPSGESAKSKYAGHTVCLGTNGKPYIGWHGVAPNDHDAVEKGWSISFPHRDSVPVTLKKYKEMGMPNQVLIYANEVDFKKGKKPIETVDFVVDTTGVTTEVELNDWVTAEYSFCQWNRPFYGEFNEFGYLNNAIEDALRNTRIKLSKSGNIRGSGSGKYYNKHEKDIKYVDDANVYKEVQITSDQVTVTISGHVDKDTGKGTFRMSGTGRYSFNLTSPSMDDDWNRTLTFEAVGEVIAKKVRCDDNTSGLGFSFEADVNGHANGTYHRENKANKYKDGSTEKGTIDNEVYEDPLSKTRPHIIMDFIVHD